MIELTPTLDILPLFGFLLPILNQYVWGGWYLAKEAAEKQRINLGLYALIAIVAVVGSLPVVGAWTVYSGELVQGWILPAIVDVAYALVMSAGSYQGIKHILNK